MASSAMKKKRAMAGLVGRSVKAQPKDPNAPYCMVCHKSLAGRRVRQPVPGLWGAWYIVCSRECGERVS